jgi:hypothetical protein
MNPRRPAKIRRIAVGFSLKPEHLDLLHKEAKRCGLTVSAYVRLILVPHLTYEVPTEPGNIFPFSPRGSPN